MYKSGDIDIDNREVRKKVRFIISCDSCKKSFFLEKALRKEFYNSILGSKQSGLDLNCQECIDKKLLPPLADNFDINQFTEEQLQILYILNKNPLRNKAYQVLFNTTNLEKAREHPNYEHFWEIINSLKPHNLLTIENSYGNSIKSFKVNPHIIPLLPTDSRLNWNNTEIANDIELDFYKNRVTELDLEIKRLKENVGKYLDKIKDLVADNSDDIPF